ncbi:MAG: phage tail protein [Actinomycetota bacterium]
MADPFVAEIRIFGFNFAPTGWAQCNGQLMPISQNTALFALVGTFYGGDGKSTFALPDMQGNAPVHPGQGQGLSPYDVGQSGGSDTVTLLQSEMPVHTHSMVASNQQANQLSPAPDRTLARTAGGFGYQTNTTQNLTTMDQNSLSITGTGLPHNNRQPSLTLNFCIALQGVFPQRP